MREMNLPEHWKAVRLGDYIFKPEYGYTASATHDSIGAKFLRITDIQDDSVNWKDVPYCECDEDTKKKYLLVPGDIVVARIGATTGKAYLVDDCPESIFASYLIRVKPKSSLFSPFLSAYFRTEDYWRQIRQNKGGRLKGGVNIPILQTLKIPLPSLPEQRAIAHVLQTIQEAKSTRQRELALERERKAALMDHLFSYGTKGEPRKQTEIGEIPESWEVVQIGEVGQVVTGNTPKTSVPEYYGGPYMFIAPGDISEAQYVTKTNKYVSAKGLKVLRPLPRDSVLVVCIGATIGKTAMTSVEPSVTNQQINAIVPNAKAFPHYVYYAVTYRSRSLPSLAGRAAIPIVKKSIFAKFPILLPLLSEQHTIAETLQAFDIKIAALEQEVERLDELFHAMLDELMTGKRFAMPLIGAGLPN